jgi:hypothetical protein
MERAERNDAGVRIQPISIPRTPMALAATVDRNTIALQWTPPTGESPSAYIIEGGSAPGLTDLVRFRTGATPALIATAVPSGTYNFRVRAVSRSGHSPPSSEVAVTVAGGCTAIPEAPGKPQATVSGNRIRFDWEMPSRGCAPSTFNIEVGGARGFSDRARFSSGSSSTVVEAAALPAGRYYARVRSVGPVGMSSPSIEMEFVIRPAACSGVPRPPTALSVFVSGPRANLRWTAPNTPNEDLDGYTVEIGSGPGLSNVGTIETKTAATWASFPAESGQYFARIRTKNGCGVSVASTEVSYTVDGVNSSPDFSAAIRALRRVRSTAYILAPTGNGRDVPAISRLPANLIILQLLYTREQIAQIKAATGAIVLADVDASELITGVNPGLLGEDFVGNPVPGFPGLYSARYWLPSWFEKVIKPNLDRALTLGFDGVFFDSANGHQWLPGNELGNAVYPNAIAEMVNLLIKSSNYLHQARPDSIAVPNNINSDNMLRDYPAIVDHIDSVVAEAQFWRQRASSPSTNTGLVAGVYGPLQATGRRVFAVDYVPRDQLDLQLRYADVALKYGWVPELTDPLQTADALYSHPHFVFSYEPGETVRGFDGGINVMHAVAAYVIGGQGAVNYAIFAGPEANYSISMNGAETLLTGGPEGTVAVVGVQYLRFSDGTTLALPAR